MNRLFYCKYLFEIYLSSFYIFNIIYQLFKDYNMKKTLLSLLFLALFLVSCDEDSSTDNNSNDASIVTNTSSAQMVVNSQRVFYADVKNSEDTEVEWQVLTSNGGTVEATDGNYAIYTAPSSVMNVVLEVRLKSDPSVKAAININVLEEMPLDEIIFDNGNIAAVQNNPNNPTEFGIEKSYKITYLENYHYFNNGVLPGYISLENEDGTVYGPWKCVGIVGQGNVANAYWVCYPNVVIKPGNYKVVDSDPATWSHNSQSDYCGFTKIRGIAQ